MATRARSPWLLLSLSALGFAGLGLPDGVLGVAWPSIRSSFALEQDALGPLLVATMTGYVASSFTSGQLLARMTIGMLLALSCLATATSFFVYSIVPMWGVVVAFGLLAGLGAGAIDAGINTYVATHHSARTLSLLHACYGLGTAAGPAIMTSVLMSGWAWQHGYRIVALAQLALALCFVLTHRLWPVSTGGRGEQAEAVPMLATLRRRETLLATATFFVYVGLEATIGVWIYSLLSGARGVSMTTAGMAVSLYWGGLMVGRLVFALAPHSWSASALLRPCIASLVVASGVLAADVGTAADLLAVIGFGVAAGPVFPAMVVTTPQRFGAAHTANAVGFQVAAAALGQALLPALVGVVIEMRDLGVVAMAALLGSSVLLMVYRTLERVAPTAEVRQATAIGSLAS